MLRLLNASAGLHFSTHPLITRLRRNRPASVQCRVLRILTVPRLEGRPVRLMACCKPFSNLAPRSRFSAIPAQQQGFGGNLFNYAPVNQTFNGFSPVPFLGSAAQSYGMPTGNNLNLGNYSGLGGTYAPAGAFQDSFMQPGQMPDSAQFSGNNAESATGGSTNAKTKNSEKTGKKNIAKSNHTGTRQTNPKIHSSRSHAGQPVR
jgi:hypothetical protein